MIQTVSTHREQRCDTKEKTRTCRSAQKHCEDAKSCVDAGDGATLSVRRVPGNPVQPVRGCEGGG